MRERARYISGQLEVWSESGWARKHAWSTLLIRKTAVPSQMTRQLLIVQRGHREQCRLPKPADWISSTM